MRHLLSFLLLAAASSAGAVVIRDDVDDSAYRVDAAEFPALVDLPHEGHGVLVSPRWVLTAAHAIAWQEVKAVEIGGVTREVARIVVHEGYRKLPDDLVAQAMKAHDASAAMAFLAGSDDLALIELAEPVRDIAPLPLYRGDAELGRDALIVGKGATGGGRAGAGEHDPHRTVLRRAHNTIGVVDDRWIAYRFREGAGAHALEGVSCNGDSGGPLLIDVDGRAEVAGIASFKRVEGDPGEYHPCRYGQQSYNARVSRYIAWIDRVIAGAGEHDRE